MINKLLNDRSYHIEFNGHLTNHAKHAVMLVLANPTFSHLDILDQMTYLGQPQ